MVRSLQGACLLAALAAPLAIAQTPVGPEFRVNTVTYGDQTYPALAADGSNGFVVAWSSYPRDAGNYAIYGRRFGADGGPLDVAEFRVSTSTIPFYPWPVVAAAPDGRLAFAWQTYGSDGSGGAVQARVFDNSAMALGPDFHVNGYTLGRQHTAAVAPDSLGGFTVVWNSGHLGQGVFGQRLDDSGAALGAEFMANTYVAGNQYSKRGALAPAADGGFVVVWTSRDGQDGDLQGVFGRRFDSAGVPLGAEFQLNQHTTSGQLEPAIASDASGNFLVVWTSYTQPGGAAADIVGRRYDANGAPQGDEFLVNATTGGRQQRPRVALDARSNFVVVWRGPGPSQNYEVFGRIFGSAGPLSTDFALGTRAAGVRSDPVVASTAAGDFVVAWVASDDQGSFDIVARRFRGDLIFADGFESGNLSAWVGSETDSGDLVAGSAAGMDGTILGLEGLVDDTAGLYVEDDSPESEPRYRARFWIDPNGFDPGVAQGHLRTRVFVALTEAPSRRVAAVVLRLQAGVYGLLGRARRDDDTQADTGFFAISDGPHAVEIDLKPATSADAQDGTFELFIDGESKALLTGLDNSEAAVDLARLGALSVKSGATGTLYWDEFESRRMSYIGP